MFSKDYNKVKDIYSIPCATYIGGKKAIKVKDNWAYVQYADGMCIYKYSKGNEVWERVKTIISTNF